MRAAWRFAILHLFKRIGGSMLVYYCAKCQRQNPRNQCDSCGKALAGTSARYIWSDYRLPLTDVVKAARVIIGKDTIG